MKKVFLVITILTFCSTLLSCGAALNSLTGSISDFEWWNLGFERVEIKLYEEGLQIRYLKYHTDATEPDIVASVMVLREGTAILADTDISLLLYGAVDRFVRVRDETGSLVEDPHPFPGISDGIIRFSKLSNTSGRTVEGEFYITFTNGYTLNGKFSGNLIVQE